MTAAVSLAPPPALAASGDITTIAGDYSRPRPATEVGIMPSGVVSRDGYTYAADSGQNVIWEFDPSGTARILAGTGDRCNPTTAPCGDGGPASAARMSVPQGLALDSAGNLFVADSQRVRRIEASNGRPARTSTITTVVGTGAASSTGDGGPAGAATTYASSLAFDSVGNLFISETYAHVVRRVVAGGDGLIGPADTIELVAGSRAFCAPDPVTDVDADCGFAGGPATAAKIYQPQQIVPVGTGILYIAGQRNRVILRVDGVGTGNPTIARVAGTGAPCPDPAGGCGDGGAATSATFGIPPGPVDSGPVGLALMPGGATLIVGDQNRHRLRDLTYAGNIVGLAGIGTACTLGSGCGDGGAAVNAQFNLPGQLFVESNGGLLVADQTKVRRLAPDTNLNPARPSGQSTVSTVAGTGWAMMGCLPYAVCGDGGPAIDARLAGTSGIAVDGAGRIYVGDHGGRRIRRIDPDGTITTISGGPDDCLSTLAPCGDGGPASDARYNSVSDLTTDAAGNLYLTDTLAHRVRRILAGADGAAGAGDTVETITGNGSLCGAEPCGDGGAASTGTLGFPGGVAVNGAGDVYVVEQVGRVRRIVASGGSVSRSSPIERVAGNGQFCAEPCGDGGPAGSAGLNGGDDIAATANGDLVISTLAGRLRHIAAADGRATAAGTITTLNPSPSACPTPTSPCGDGGTLVNAATMGSLRLATDPAGGLYLSESAGNRVRRVYPSGGTVGRDSPIVRLAGTGEDCAFGSTLSPCGDGEPAQAARLYRPSGIAVGPGFDAFIIDRSRVRRVEANTSPVASLTAEPATGAAPLAVTLSLGATPGNGGPLASWRLSFGDGTADATGNGAPPATISHTYATAAVYTARLTITDDRSVPATATTAINADDRTPPTVSGFGASPSTFRVGSEATARAAAAAARAAAAVGTTFRYTTTEAGSGELGFEQALAGRKSGSNCVALKKGQRSNCTRHVRVGSLAPRPANEGANAIPFSGRLGTKPLKKGRYRVTLIARDRSNNAAAPVTTDITVVAPTLTVKVRRRSLQTVVRSGGLIAALNCSDPCRLRATVKLGKRKVASGTGRIPGAGRTLLRLKLSKRGARMLRAKRSVKLVLRVTAADDAGNASTKTVRFVVRRR